MAQPKCKVPDCPRTAIPGKSPHGYCLRHEAELTYKRGCPFPGCPATPQPGQSPNGCCQNHEQFIKDLCFILPHIQSGKPGAPVAKPAAPKPKSGLVLPGDPGFSVLQLNTG